MHATSRFSLVSRRAVLAGAGAGAVLGLAGCTDDRATLGSGAGGLPSAAAPPASSTPPTGASMPGAPGGAPVTIAFTYKATADSGPAGRGGGPVRNPYVAVWVEDGAGTLVKTVALWHLQGRDNWLNELRRWYQVSGGKDTGSSATRSAGSYQVAWDRTDLQGAKTSLTSAYVCLESAREHGPYSLVRQRVDLGTAATVTLADQGELVGITVKVAG